MDGLKVLPIVLLIAAASSAAIAAPAKTPRPVAALDYDGVYCSGKGDTGYLRLIDQSFGFFHPNPYRQNISMLYLGKEERLCENAAWYMWWIQNSYGPSFCSTPFLKEPWLTAMQNANDLWFKFQGDGKQIRGFPPEPAPDGSLMDCAGPTTVIYKQGDMDTSLHKLHDWFYEGAAAGVVMQSELLLVSRDMAAIRRYIGNLDRACDFVERTRDPKNNLFLVGCAANLLAPSYGGIKKPDGTYGKGYLSGVSINYLAAVDRMIELHKMLGNKAKVTTYEHRRKITRDSLPLLMTKEGYFCKSMETGGLQHGVYGQKDFGYFEVAPNVDSVCFRAINDAQAKKVIAKTTAIPQLRPYGTLITNYPSLDDSYIDGGSTSDASKAVNKIMEFGRWVNGGVWTTMEARAIMAYARTGHYDDLLKSMHSTMDFATAFHLDAPLGSFGKSGWYPGTMGLCWDSLGPPAATARGLFEYVYSADSLALYPHIPAAITHYNQKEPIRFGKKTVTISVVKKGPNVVSATVNGKLIRTLSKDSVKLMYATLPTNAKVQIVMGGGKAAGSVRAADTSFVPVDPKVPATLKELPAALAANRKHLIAMQDRIAAEPASDYEKTFIKVAISAFDAYAERDSMHEGGLYPADKRAGMLAWYQDAAGNVYAGLETMMARYEKSGNARQKRLAVAFSETKPAAK